jgi:peptide/nickel transport system permease protein
MFVFVGMAVFAPYLVTYDPTPTSIVAPSFLQPSWMAIFNPNGVLSGEILPDPNLDTPQTIAINGTSGEFSGVSVPKSENLDSGYVNLTWTHTAGTALPIHIDPEGQKPDCSDFIYFEQSLNWTYNNRPSDVNMSVDYGTVRTGDFADGGPAGNNLMFRVYVWILDSRNVWTRVFESRDATYVQNIQLKRISMNIVNIKAVFDGMIKTNGTQEDPTDTLRVRIGLSPYRYFNNSAYGFGGYTYPWQCYNGSVTFTFTKLQMVAYGEYFGILGTTNQGADAYSQIIYGSRISLTVGVLATAVSTALGVIVGLVAGYFGGKTDEVLMRMVDFLLVIPGLPLMMVLAAILGANITNIILVIAILGWTGTSRLIRSQVLAEKNKAYVESARAIGASDTYIMFRHILPNVTPILFANITLGVVGAILSEAGLSFLGLTNPEDPSWGRMLADANSSGAFSNGAWWVVLFPGLMITLLSLSFTFVGHTLDQVLNPRLRER